MRDNPAMVKKADYSRFWPVNSISKVSIYNNKPKEKPNLANRFNPFFKNSHKRYLKKVILSAWMYFGDSWCGGGGAGSGASQLKSAPVPHPANHSPNPTPNYLKSTLILDFTPLSRILFKKIRKFYYSSKVSSSDFFFWIESRIQESSETSFQT